MNVIDLEILIPASPEFIWRFMGDLAAIPQWYEDAVSVSFLSTQREGRGTRWRHSTVRGSDVIVEISAWYDTLGYEYRIVDGTTYSENQGRIRLHEVTDGTQVRWTFQYEAGGVLGGLRNAMRLKRNTTNQIQDSLRNLHQLIMQESGGISTHEAKASMQDAPDVNERLSYQPRHPSAFHDGALDEFDDDTSLSERLPLAYDLELEPAAIPQVADSDTKPNPVALGASADLIPEAAPEPKLDDTRPMEVEVLLAEDSPPEVSSPLKAEAEPEAPAPVPKAQAPKDDPPTPDTSLAPKPQDDSSHLSVFEIFGLQKPSEARTQPERADKPLSDFGATLPDRGPHASSAGELKPAGAANDLKPDEQPAQADATTISGWRRSARRKKTRIRSHT